MIEDKIIGFMGLLELFGSIGSLGFVELGNGYGVKASCVFIGWVCAWPTAFYRLSQHRESANHPTHGCPGTLLQDSRNEDGIPRAFSIAKRKIVDQEVFRFDIRSQRLQ
jgi:hypothetical protein